MIVNWLIAHKPVKLFIRTAHEFKKQLAEATNGELEIVIHEKESEWVFEAETGKNCVTALQDNDFQMSQTPVYLIGQMHDQTKDFLALDLPYLFDSHEHCTAVMEGPVGNALNRRLSKTFDVTGLAYTYSGGYRNIGANESITSLSDLQGQKVRVGSNPINQDFMTELGAVPSRVKIEDENGLYVENVSDLDVKAVENTYTRFPEAMHWYKTNHSMFITDIMVSNKFWNTLSPEMQTTFREIAVKVARIERAWSEDDHDAYEKSAELHGKTITSVTEEDKVTMKQKAKPVYDKWSKIITPGLLAAISNTKH
mgnify:CR=1 FL=1